MLTAQYRKVLGNICCKYILLFNFSALALRGPCLNYFRVVAWYSDAGRRWYGRLWSRTKSKPVQFGFFRDIRVRVSFATRIESYYRVPLLPLRYGKPFVLSLGAVSQGLGGFDFQFLISPFSAFCECSPKT